MNILQATMQPKISAAAARPTEIEAHGWVGKAMNLLQKLSSRTDARSRQLRLVESLSLGGRKQLMLVAYGEEEFLVGGGAESVQTILHLSPRAQKEPRPKI